MLKVGKLAQCFKDEVEEESNSAKEENRAVDKAEKDQFIMKITKQWPEYPD